MSFLTPTAYAAVPGGLSFDMSPLLVELNARAGQSQAFEILVINQSNVEAATFNVSVASVDENRNGGYVIVESDDAPFSAVSWIQVSPAQFTLGPGEGIRVIGQVTVPRGEQGGRYAAVVLELQPEEKQDQEARASTVVQYQLATIVELTIGDRFRKQAYISGIEVIPATDVPPLAAQFGEQALWIKAGLTNESNIHVLGEGMLTIRNAEGRKMLEIPLGQGRGAVLPDATLDFSSILPAGLPPGEYTLQAVIYYGGLRPAIAKRTFVIEGGQLRTDGFAGGRVVRFDVQPSEFALELPAGAVRMETIQLANLSDNTILVTSQVQPLIYDAQGQLDAIQMEEQQTSVSWVQISPSEVTLRPNQRRNVRVMIRNPREVAGGKYAQATFQATEIDSRTRRPISGGLVSDLGTSIVMLPKDGQTRGAEIMSLDIIPPNEETSLGAAVEMTNTGNVHFKGRGTMALFHKVIPESIDGVEYVGDGIFEKIWEGPLPEDVLERVLPGENRRIVGTISNPLDPGHYRLNVSVNYAGSVPATAQKEFVIAAPADQAATPDQ